jgi:hypothetical protein
MAEIPLLARLILLDPERVLATLDRATDPNLARPNAWQLSLGVLRMWHRVLFRSDSVGLSAAPVRKTWRARLLRNRVLRLPFLLGEDAVRPLDHTGLRGTPAQIIGHLMGAHHDENQFVYDLEILAACHPGALEACLATVDALLALPDSPRNAWLRDLTIWEGYHESLRDAVQHAIAHGPRMTDAEANDPDLSFRAYLRWCAAQPPTPAATVRAFFSRHAVHSGPLSAADVRAMSRADLATILASGDPVDPDALAGATYRGVSLGLPRVVEKLSWKTFAKAFARDDRTGAVHGWNLAVEQDPDLDAPIRPRARAPYGPFAVIRDAADGTILDYGARHPRHHPLSRVRDRLVTVNHGSHDLLLGRIDITLAGRHIPTPSWFTLARESC